MVSLIPNSRFLKPPASLVLHMNEERGKEHLPVAILERQPGNLIESLVLDFRFDQAATFACPALLRQPSCAHA
jgi:hypothetical protein